MILQSAPSAPRKGLRDLQRGAAAEIDPSLLRREHANVGAVLRRTWLARLFLWLVASSTFSVSAAAQTTQISQLPVIKQLSIEELLELDVTLPLRRDARVMDAPAAITVLTAEDLRRQGAVSLPEALRHVSGLFVGRFSNSAWVIASRGFANTSANKMLVMIDGRSVYSPLFSGVFWEQQDAMLLDLDRVEVIRGPGASLWGANAVNGVINVVSKRAADTQGTLVNVGGGSEEQFMTGVRYGGRAGAGHYRVYGKFFQRDAARLANDQDANDGQRFGQAGFRTDWDRASDAFTLQGDVFRTTNEPFASGEQIASDGINLLARWTRRPSSRSEWQAQSYIDRTHRFVPNQIDEKRTTWDLDVQQRWIAHERHTLSAGGSYRYSTDETVASPLLAFDPASRATHLFSAFVQDEFALSATVMAIAGTKVERNDYTGVEWQPSVRLRWMPTSVQNLWGAVSRAVRMPTRFDTDIRVFQGPSLVAVGNPDFRSESVVAFEAGYRVAPSPRVAFDLTAFHNRYDDLRTQDFTGTRVVLGNGLNNRSVGANVTMTVQPRSWVRLTGSYTRLAHDLSLDEGSTDVFRGQFETIDANHMARVTGRFDLPGRVELDVMTTFIGALPQIRPDIPGTPSYNEAGFRLGWRLSPGAEIAFIGRDVLNAGHVEFASPTTSRVTVLERALFTRITLSF
jgi:iron complex outermembrane receptor protein